MKEAWRPTCRSSGGSEFQIFAPGMSAGQWGAVNKRDGEAAARGRGVQQDIQELAPCGSDGQGRHGGARFWLSLGATSALGGEERQERSSQSVAYRYPALLSNQRSCSSVGREARVLCFRLFALKQAAGLTGRSGNCNSSSSPSFSSTSTRKIDCVLARVMEEFLLNWPLCP